MQYATRIIVGSAVGLLLLLSVGCEERRPVRTPVPSAPDTTAAVGASPFVGVAYQLRPSVVSISTPRTLPRLPRLNLPRLLRRAPAATQPDPDDAALASGVVIDSDGHILTSYRPIRRFRQFRVRLADGTIIPESRVKLVGSDDKTDLAVLRLTTDVPLRPARFADSDSIRIGDWVLAIGSQYGLQGTVTAGVVSAAGRSGLVYPDAPSYQDFIQTDAAVNPGSAGGPLVNLRGEIVGINTVFRSPVGANVGIAFAIPSNTARIVSRQLTRTGRVVRGYIGVTVQEISPRLREALGLTGTDGVLVTEVLSGTPGARAGLQPEDVVTMLDSVPIRSLEHFRSEIAGRAPGTETQLAVRRGDTILRLPVRLTRMPGNALTRTDLPSATSTSWLGMSLRNPSAAELKTARLRSGIGIDAVDPDSPADRAGILAGDYLVAVNRRPVRSVGELPSIGRLGPTGQLELRRGDARLLVTITTGQ